MTFSFFFSFTITFYPNLLASVAAFVVSTYYFSGNNPFDLRKCDIFSLGASIYEIVRGKRLPQRGKEWHALRDGLVEFPKNKMENEEECDNQQPILISKELEIMLRKMMSSNPKDRPNARELLESPLLQTERELRLAKAEALLKSHEALQMQREQQKLLGNFESLSAPKMKRSITM